MFILKLRFATSPKKNCQPHGQGKKHSFSCSVTHRLQPMDSVQRINVLESYDLKFCCVCVQNGDQSYLNVFENVIQYQNVYISLAQIINETLSPLNVRSFTEKR